MKYIPGLNGLRALAVSFVVFYHWNPPPLYGVDILRKVLPDGRFGVNLFFVLSGFLISRNLIMEKEKISPLYRPKKLILHFYIRRMLRIFPVYYLSLIIVYLLGAPFFNENLIFYATYTENISLFIKQSGDFFMHSWSLGVEEQFYLFWPFIIIFLNRKQVFRVLIFFIFFAPVYTCFQAYVLNNGWFTLIPSCLDAFGIGALIAYLYAEDSLQLMNKWVKWLLPIALIFFIYRQMHPLGHFQYLVRFSDSILSAGIILFCLSKKHTGIVQRFLENPVLYQVGLVSYGIYIYHYPLPYFYHWFRYHAEYSNHISNTPADYFVMLVILLALSFLSYYFFEKPLLSLKRRFQ